jgi:hypothetical protein
MILAAAVIFSLCVPFMCPQTRGKVPKSKFYDFSEQLIDGEIKKPTTLYMDSREKVKFDRLMKLKKSFLPKLFKTAKEKIFK